MEGEADNQQEHPTETEVTIENEPTGDTEPQENTENASNKEDVQPTDVTKVPELEVPKVEGDKEEKEVEGSKTASEGLAPEGLEEVKVIGKMDIDDTTSIATTIGMHSTENKQRPEYMTDSLMKFYKYMGLAPEEAEEIHEVKKEVVKIDRAPYYEKHAALAKEIEEEKLKNNIIQKKLSRYFKKKKMDHVLKESGDQFDSQQKYNKKLDAYGEIMEVDTRERNAISSELTKLKDKRESKYKELTKLFEEMQQREKETGFGLINTKTGKSIPDKLVERLIRLQRSQMETVNTMRLKYIRLKDLVAEKQNKITILDKIGENLYLKDYEQLKIENRGLEDKIEERDDELSKLRSKYQSNIQLLAHVREKSSALQSDIDNLKEDISKIDAQSVKVREELNGFKQQRDYYRNMANNIHNESGLLTETELLRDMEDSMEKLNLLSAELESLKQENKVKAQQIRNIRKNIELSTEVLAKKSMYKNIDDALGTYPQLYKRRPTLYRPTLPEDAFQGLKEYKFKSSFKYLKKKKKKKIMKK